MCGERFRNPLLRFCVYSVMALVAAMGLVGCATPTPKTDDQKQADEQKTSAVETSPGPFGVAQRWASELSADTAPVAVRETVSEWNTARVARVWASGEEYRALVVQKSTARETPAVLLRITRGDANRWQVTGAEPATSTHLWSEL